MLERILRFGEGKRLKEFVKQAELVGNHADELSGMSDAELRAMTDEFRERLADGETLDDLLPEAFATVREAASRTLGQRHFDVQLMGGAALHMGNIAEMRTGEGKTLTSVLPAYLNALSGQGVHVVTVNDYLAKRDSEWMGRVHRFLGLEVGVILSQQPPEERRKQYEADITYGTNNEFGFDYLRDNMAWGLEECVQRGHIYGIVDEVDSILIDEARTPLIISGPAEQSARWYTEFAKIAPRLRKSEEEDDGGDNEGMHQAIEAKEGVVIQNENQTLATITLQNYFRLYEKLAGMTGTAQTEAAELHEIYKLGVVSIPTNKEMIRADQSDLIYKTEEAKYIAVVDDVSERFEKGQPALIGTTSVERS